MSKQRGGIRWRKRDLEEVQRVINNFNSKLYRTKKNKPELEDYLPNRLKKSEVIESIKTRADFNKILNSYKRFSKRGAENLEKSTRGAKAIKWEVEEFKINQEEMNKQRTKELKKLKKTPKKSRGEKIGYNYGMGTITENELLPSQTKFESLSQKEWEWKKRVIDSAIDPLQSELGKHNYRLNYIKGLRNVGYSEDIVNLVLKLPIDKFIEVTRTDTEGDFDFIYDEIEFKNKQDALYEVWENAVEEWENEK